AIADYYLNLNLNKAIDYYERSKYLAEKLNNKSQLASSYYSLGSCFLAKGNFDLSLENYLKAVRLYEELNHKRRLTKTYIDIAYLYTEYAYYSKAHDYFDKAKLLIDQSQDTLELNYYFQEKGNFYYRQAKFDSAILCNMESNRIAALIKNDNYSIPNTLSNIGLMYKKMGRLDDALLYIDSALILLNQSGDLEFLLSGIYNNLACIYSAKHQFDSALVFFNKSIALCKTSHNIFTEMENYSNLAEMYGIKKQYDLQVHYLKNYYNLKDSLFNTDKQNQLNQLETDYQLEKKDKLITKKNLELIKQKNTRNLSFIFSAFALILLSSLYYYYRKLKLKNLDLELKNTLIENQKTELQQLNHIKDRLFGIISHDLRNPLITLRSYLMLSDNESISADKKILFKNQTMEAVNQTGDLLDNLLTWANLQLKNVETPLVPIALDECVADVVNILKVQAKQKEIEIIQRIQAIVFPSNSDVLSIVLRNLITNAIKFSKEKQAIILESNQNEQGIQLIVQDFGQGLSSEQIHAILSSTNDSTLGTKGEKGSGLDLFLVMQMLKKINAQLLIESQLGIGSKFIVFWKETQDV
ncbi:MAG: tetratricopeptide repeat-containing sensor histidine kinase, partial [Saprospiraceae bacterium]